MVRTFPTTARHTEQRQEQTTLFNVVIGLTALAVALQGVWAGIFLEHDGARDAASAWIDVHARGADVAIVLAGAATVVAFVMMRDRRDLWAGSAVLTALLIAESYLGGLIRDASQDVLTAVHVPLAMALMALVVWLPLRVGRPHARRHRTEPQMVKARG